MLSGQSSLEYKCAYLCLYIEMMVFLASFVHIVYAKLGQADAGDSEAKLMTKLAPECMGSN